MSKSVANRRWDAGRVKPGIYLCELANTDKVNVSVSDISSGSVLQKSRPIDGSENLPIF